MAYGSRRPSERCSRAKGSLERWACQATAERITTNSRAKDTTAFTTSCPSLLLHETGHLLQVSGSFLCSSRPIVRLTVQSMLFCHDHPAFQGDGGVIQIGRPVPLAIHGAYV